ncbi:MAG: type secretion system family protein, partial [Paucimonas sp.]|nr:type secretion system family protein [Paucimonas sp.]
PSLIFLCVTFGLAGLYFWIIPNATQRRLRAMSEPKNESAWVETMAGVVAPFAKLSTPDGAWEDSPTRLKFLTAGIRHEQARLVYFGLKTVLPVAFAGLAFFLLRSFSEITGMKMILVLMVAALFGCYLPNAFLHWRIRARRRQIFDNFPDAADLMLVCMEAGLGLDAGLTRVAEEIRMKSPALAEELHLTNLEMRAGGTRETSLRHLARRTGVEEISTFAAMLTQADKFGTSIGESMRVFSEDLRHKRQTRAEELAAKVPTKMLFPLVVCIFPSIIMVIMGPAAIRIIRTLLPMINHGG